MSEIIYNPDDVGKEFPNPKGDMVKIRKYHLTKKEMESARKKWLASLSNVDQSIIDRAGPHFFNPYRKGIYYYQVQTLFLLGCNEWHTLPDVLSKLEEYTTGIPVERTTDKKQGYTTAWDKFRGKTSRENAVKAKDYIGRIQENFVLLQRLSWLHPYGYKLHQVHAAIDIKRVDEPGFPQGLFSYRLSTYDRQVDAKPIKDFSQYTFPKHEKKYVSRKFIGTIVTRESRIVDGVKV